MANRRGFGSAVALLCGCVYPNNAPTGIEFSWRFHEVEPSDGEDALRLLSCSGAGVDTMGILIEDTEDPTRRGGFSFPCSQGYQTPNQAIRDSSDVFVELRGREYDVSLVAAVGPGEEEVLAERPVEVQSRDVTVEAWELTRASIDWTLRLLHPEACEQVQLGLFYADPATALAEPERDGDDRAVEVLYRKKLASDRGLGLAEHVRACDEVGGDHVFGGIDRGVYRLEVSVDGIQCAVSLRLAPDVVTTLDLASACGA